MSKKIKGSYLLNAVSVALVFALLTGLFAANAFGTSTTYIQGICTTACYTIIMVTSLNLVVGFMGEFSLGHAGFVSVGAYVSAIVSGALAGKGLSDLGLFLIALLVGGLAAGIMGVLVGIPALRLRGDYLAIVTMAFAEIIRVCFCNFSITGGGKTMSGILKLSTFPRVFWIMVVCVTIMYLFVRSKYGRTVQAIREDYIAASASGINVTYYKVMTFAISAFFAGIGGGIYAHYIIRILQSPLPAPVVRAAAATLASSWQRHLTLTCMTASCCALPQRTAASARNCLPTPMRTPAKPCCTGFRNGCMTAASSRRKAATLSAMKTCSTTRPRCCGSC